VTRTVPNRVASALPRPVSSRVRVIPSVPRRHRHRPRGRGRKSGKAAGRKSRQKNYTLLDFPEAGLDTWSRWAKPVKATLAGWSRALPMSGSAADSASGRSRPRRRSRRRGPPRRALELDVRRGEWCGCRHRAWLVPAENAQVSTCIC